LEFEKGVRPIFISNLPHLGNDSLLSVLLYDRRSETLIHPSQVVRDQIQLSVTALRHVTHITANERTKELKHGAWAGATGSRPKSCLILGDVKMKPISWVGIFLIVLGALVLAYQGIKATAPDRKGFCQGEKTE
jgi:hypothetical protein